MQTIGGRLVKTASKALQTAGVTVSDALLLPGESVSLQAHDMREESGLLQWEHSRKGRSAAEGAFAKSWPAAEGGGSKRGKA